MLQCCFPNITTKPKRVTFAVASDLHVCKRTDGIPAAVPPVAGRFDNWNDHVRNFVVAVCCGQYDFVVLNGDLVDYFHNEDPEDKDPVGSRPVDVQESSWSTFRELFQPFEAKGIPVLATPGNHDVHLFSYPLTVSLGRTRIKNLGATYNLKGKDSQRYDAQRRSYFPPLAISSYPLKNERNCYGCTGFAFDRQGEVEFSSGPRACFMFLDSGVQADTEIEMLSDPFARLSGLNDYSYNLLRRYANFQGQLLVFCHAPLICTLDDSNTSSDSPFVAKEYGPGISADDEAWRLKLNVGTFRDYNREVGDLIVSRGERGLSTILFHGHTHLLRAYRLIDQHCNPSPHAPNVPDFTRHFDGGWNLVNSLNKAGKDWWSTANPNLIVSGRCVGPKPIEDNGSQCYLHVEMEEGLVSKVEYKPV